MKCVHFRAVLFSLLFAFLVSGVAGAQEQPLQFIHALQEKGYGDIAVDYLKILTKREDLPKEVRDVLDLEMSKSLKSAASSAFDAKEYDALMKESQEYLAKFIKEKPNHPDAMIAMASWGDFLLKQALETLRQAKAMANKPKEKEQYEKTLTEARTGIADAKSKFEQARKKFKERLDTMPPAPKQTTRRGAAARNPAAEARAQMVSYLNEADFQLALIEYYLAQTYSDPKNADRVAGLKKAAKMFDDIYQLNRGSITGLYAHMWHGKTSEELGDDQTALDIYDEVLANAPAPEERGAETGLEPLFTQVEHFRFIIIGKDKKKQKEYLGEASNWLKDYKRWKQTEGYQGIALDVAKATLAYCEKLEPSQSKKLLSEVYKAVNDCSKVRSPYQAEFLALKRELLQKRGESSDEANTFEDCVAAGDEYVKESNWAKALECYEKGIGIADKKKTTKKAEVDAVREAMGRVQFMIARDLFNKGKLTECIDMVKKIVVDSDGKVKKDSAAAASASALGVTAALNIYVGLADPKANSPAEKIKAALDVLTGVAEFTIKNWPDRPEADDARIALAQAKIVVEETRDAVKILVRVNPKSERYSSAMYLAGLNSWRLCIIERAKQKGEPDKKQMAEDRARAVECLGAALEIFKKQFEAGKPLPKYMLETQLLLAEIRQDGGESKEAVELYQPLVDMAKADKKPTFDANTMRIFLGAVRAYSSLDKLDKAGEVGSLLIELGPDTPEINDSLMRFARLLNVERQKADAAVTNAEAGNEPGALDAAKTKLGAVQELLGKILVKLAVRKELGLGSMMFIGETLNTIGMTNEASEQFQRIIKRTEEDPQFAKEAAKAMSRIRAELLKVLRDQGKYEDAIKQVNKLIETNPNALALLMEKGRILEAWAEKNPAKFEDAVKHWADLRNRLQPMKKKPPEYFEVMYNVAKCLMREAEKSKDKTVIMDRANTAEKVLKSPLITLRKSMGPDMVAKYTALLNKAIIMQGRKPTDTTTEKKK